MNAKELSQRMAGEAASIAQYLLPGGKRKAWLSAHFVIMTMGILAQLPDASRTLRPVGLRLRSS